jgi:hypothetical protein
MKLNPAKCTFGVPAANSLTTHASEGYQDNSKVAKNSTCTN